MPLHGIRIRICRAIHLRTCGCFPQEERDQALEAVRGAVERIRQEQSNPLQSMGAASGEADLDDCI